MQLVATDFQCLYPLGQSLALGAIPSALYHERRPIRCRHMVAEFSHARSVQPGATTKVDQAAARRESHVEPTPHLRAHLLDEVVVSTRPIVVGGDTVERGSSFA